MNIEFSIKNLLKNKLEKQFYLQKTQKVAKELIGSILIHKVDNKYLAGIIVETEAYLAENDLASHSAPGQTKRNSSMFENGGILYVYKIYGIHHCINVVTEAKGIGAAVLIRSIQPIYGIEQMIKFRKTSQIENLCKGPGNVAKAFGFNLEHNGLSLNSKNLFISKTNSIHPENIIQTTRLGISKSKNLELRFLLKNSPFVSGNKNQNNKN